MTDSRNSSPIRAGGQFATVYNEGLTVFLYDAQHEEELRGSEAKITFFAGEEAFADPVSKALLQEGKLLVYGLTGDGEVRCEVHVGAALTTAELANGAWVTSDQGRLALPSGTLRIHSFNSLPMGDNGTDPPDQGAELQVPPGTYQVLIHRPADDDGTPRPDLVVLTPLAAPPNAPGPNILFGECIGFSPG